MSKMLEYIEISACIFMATDHVKIWVEDGKLHYSVWAMMSSQEEIPDTVSDITPETFSNQLEATGLYNWKRNYETSQIILDGENWDVKVKFAGEKVKKISGENAYPTGWKSLLKAAKSVTGFMGEIY